MYRWIMKLPIHLSVVVLLLLLVVPVWAGAEESTDPDWAISLQEVRTDRADIEADTTLDEELQTEILALYDEAITSLKAAEDHRRATAAFEKDRANIQQSVELLRERLSHPDPPVQLDDADSYTAEQARSALTRERSRLAAHRAALHEASERAAERTTRLAEIAEQLGTLDQELEAFSGDIRLVGEGDLPDEIKKAARTALVARRETTVTGIEHLRYSLVLLEERGVLIPLQVDLTQRKVIASEDKVALLEIVTNGLRQRDADKSLEQLIVVADTVTAETPELAHIAAETKAEAAGLWGQDGVVDRSEATVKALVATRKHVADLYRIVELTRRKFEAFGHRGSLTRWWPDVPEDLPDVASIEMVLDDLAQEIPEVQHQLITFEEARTNLPEQTRALIRSLQIDTSSDLEARAIRNARSLFALRHDLLDDVILEYGRYSNQLVELRSLSTDFRDRMVGVNSFLYSQLLWSRSVPKPIVPRVEDMADAAQWLMSPQTRRDSLEKSGGEQLYIIRGDVLAVLLFITVLIFHRRIKHRLAVLSDRVADPTIDRFRYTLEAFLWTILLALPVPLLLFIAGGALFRGGGGAYFNTAARALHMVSAMAFLLEGVRQLFAPHGLAESHFGWPAKLTRSFHRGLILPELIALPLLFVAIDLAFAGVRLNSPEQLRIFNNSLGRVCFIMAMLILGISILARLKPEMKGNHAARGLPWSQRLTQYAFPTAFLIAVPVIFCATIVPALLAAFGYYISGLLLAYQMEQTLLLCLAVLGAGGLIYRWWITRNRWATAVAEGEASDLPSIDEFKASETQAGRLFRFSVIVVFAVGLFSIWSDSLPFFEIMKRVQLLPRVQLLEVKDTDRLEALRARSQTESRQPEYSAAGPAVQAHVDPTAPIPDSAEADSPSAQTTESQSLTLWAVLEAILAALITLVLVQNLPFLFEFFLKRRTSLDSGATVAFATLLRYSITMLGLVVVFGVLGVTWDKVQWLAAALTFGLAFGLQEIVANFVSGLILLIERPVRVGDMVTVGNLMGRVHRIQIRATTITLLDRSEMIVPNKEFITTKLVNWTLSDSKRRIEIPIRITYGEDLERVKKIVTEIASEHPEVLDQPAPHTLLLSFGEDASQLELRFVVDFGKGLAIRDEVQMSIDKAFREAGIEFAPPQRTIHVVSSGTADDKPPLEVPGSIEGPEVPGS